MSPPQIVPSRRMSQAAPAPGVRQFPMYVLPLEDASQLEKLPTHEELMAQGKLVEWQEGMGAVAFVSQVRPRLTSSCMAQH